MGLQVHIDTSKTKSAALKMLNFNKIENRFMHVILIQHFCHCFEIMRVF